MPRRELVSLPLAPNTLGILLKGGFRTVEDVEEVPVSSLASELGMSIQDAMEFVEEIEAVCCGGEVSVNNNVTSSAHADRVQPSGSPSTQSKKKNGIGGSTALDLLQRNDTRRPIVTFCSDLDRILGGGVQIGEITEFCGAPGTGKTQIGMQIVLDAQIPACLGGLGGQAVYIDTEGSFMVERLAQMATSLLKHLRAVVKNRRQPPRSSSSSSSSTPHPSTTALSAALPPDAGALLRGVHVLRAFDAAQVTAALTHSLPQLLSSNPDICVVVVDSIAFPFRHDVDEAAARARQLTSLAGGLASLAHAHNLAVVLVNQMTTKVDPTSSKGSELVPALGESWSHAVANRVVLSRKNEVRCASLVKSAHRRRETVSYRITQDGFRGFDRKKKRPAPWGPNHPTKQQI